ncbi:MAG: tripartite tricarboxylate transporter substrate-binding protein [Hyphomicrobiaceae bacterium]
MPAPPYRGSAPAMQDLMAGHIDMMIDPPVIILPQLPGGSVKAYAVLAKSRLVQAPDVPTADEVGLPGFYVSNWLGFWVPRGTPKNIIGKLNDAAVRSLADTTVRQKLAELGYQVPPREQQNARGARRIAEGRNRQVVAHYQVGPHQGRLNGLPFKDVVSFTSLSHVGPSNERYSTSLCLRSWRPRSRTPAIPV